MMIIWIIILIAVVWLFSSGLANRRGSLNIFSDRTKALEILKARYARGEIDQAEFEDRRRNLIE